MSMQQTFKCYDVVAIMANLDTEFHELLKLFDTSRRLI